MNPYSEPLSEDEKAQESELKRLWACEQYWYHKSVEALRSGKMALRNAYYNRARFYWSLRVADVIY